VTTPLKYGGAYNDGTGVWFNPLNGYAELRGCCFPDSYFEDGQFFCCSMAHMPCLKPRSSRFAAGESVGPGTGYQAPGAGYVDLGPSYSNW
jgi:hypothetical protein